MGQWRRMEQGLVGQECGVGEASPAPRLIRMQCVCRAICSFLCALRISEDLKVVDADVRCSGFLLQFSRALASRICSGWTILDAMGSLTARYGKNSVVPLAKMLC